jgi:hypothetical protein
MFYSFIIKSALCEFRVFKLRIYVIVLTHAYVNTAVIHVSYFPNSLSLEPESSKLLIQKLDIGHNSEPLTGTQNSFTQD